MGYSLPGESRQHREGLVRTQKESNQARGTHFLESTEGGTYQDIGRKQSSNGTHQLETTEGGTCQDMERKQPSKGLSLARDHREKDLSQHQEKVTE